MKFKNLNKYFKKMPYGDLIEEHEELVKDLKSKKGLKEELKEQSKELAEYRKEAKKLSK